MTPSDSGAAGTGGELGAPGPATARCLIGRYYLDIGRPSGTLISLTDGPRVDSRQLAQAIAKTEQDERQNRQDRRAAAPDTVEAATEEASAVTAKVERAVELFTELAEGRTDPKALSDEVSALMDLLQRLDRDHRWDDALRVARALAGLLALMMRWIELLRSLRIALRAAEQLGDSDAAAWALHELGTVHLAAEKLLSAEQLLDRARELRLQLGDRRALAATDHNLQCLCQLMRQLMREGRLVQRKGLFERLGQRPTMVLIAGALLLGAAGVASAIVVGSSSNGASHASGSSQTSNSARRSNPARHGSTASSPATITAAPTTAAPTTVKPGETHSGSGVPAPLPAQLSASSLQFSEQETGTESSSQDVTATNVGHVPIALGNVTVSKDFKIVRDCSGQTVKPQAECTVSVVFAPQGSASREGEPRTGTLTFSDDGTGKQQTVALSGTTATRIR